MNDNFNLGQSLKDVIDNKGIKKTFTIKNTKTSKGRIENTKITSSGNDTNSNKKKIGLVGTTLKSKSLCEGDIYKKNTNVKVTKTTLLRTNKLVNKSNPDLKENKMTTKSIFRSSLTSINSSNSKFSNSSGKVNEKNDEIDIYQNEDLTVMLRQIVYMRLQLKKKNEHEEKNYIDDIIAGYQLVHDAEEEYNNLMIREKIANKVIDFHEKLISCEKSLNVIIEKLKSENNV